ncbi:MAG TPA: TetR family transcriptional regulator C-terminal domain-containing protein [Solirubrobacterales bacterium]|nr:TetR family transcriptional regulator C-terminal domain-containing protein [Solirubrobacterales bacterium]
MPKVVDHEQRRQELVEAAWRVIADRGIDEVTVREIAREAGYSSGVLAHYFENKDDLLVHALRLSHERIYKRYEAEVEAPRRREALEAVLMDNLPLDKQRDLETRIEMSFWARSLRNKSLSEIQHQEHEFLRDLIRRLFKGSQEEEAVVADGQTDLIVDLLAALIDGISLHALLYPDLMPPERQREIMELALTLLAPRE